MNIGLGGASNLGGAVKFLPDCVRRFGEQSEKLPEFPGGLED